MEQQVTESTLDGDVNHPRILQIDFCSESDCLLSAFRRAVARHPARLAVCSDAWQATYEELDIAASRLAHALIGRGVDRGGRVAILMRHDSPEVAAILGALKAGQAVIVLSAADSPTRLDQILNEAAPSLVVTDAINRKIAADIAQARCGINRAGSRCDFGRRRRLGRRAPASHSHRADRIPGSGRSGRCRLGRRREVSRHVTPRLLQRLCRVPLTG